MKDPAPKIMPIESKPKTESINPLEFIAPIERKIIESLTQSDKDILRNLVSSNLGESKEKIVGVRTKDIFSLFEQVHHGYLRVGLSDIMIKDTGQPPSVFFTTNPDSQYLKSKRSDILDNVEEFSDFESMVEHSQDYYGNIGVKQAVNRNIMSLIPNQEDMFRELAEIYSKSGVIKKLLPFEEYGQDVKETKEIFFNNISERIQQGIEVIRPEYIRRDPELAILGKYLKKNDISLEETRKMLLSFANRSCVQVAFGEKLFEHEVTSEKGLVHGPNEFVVYIPSQKLEFDAVVGFETKGSFEKQLLEMVLK